MSREQMRDQQIAVIRELGGEKLANWLTLRPEVVDPRPQLWRRVKSGASYGLAIGYVWPIAAWCGAPWWYVVPGTIAATLWMVYARHKRRGP